VRGTVEGRGILSERALQCSSLGILLITIVIIIVVVIIIISLSLFQFMFRDDNMKTENFYATPTQPPTGSPRFQINLQTHSFGMETTVGAFPLYATMILSSAIT
jgi:flagellar basal body-associated protein FliL